MIFVAVKIEDTINKQNCCLYRNKNHFVRFPKVTDPWTETEPSKEEDYNYKHFLMAAKAK